MPVVLVSGGARTSRPCSRRAPTRRTAPGWSPSVRTGRAPAACSPPRRPRHPDLRRVVADHADARGLGRRADRPGRRARARPGGLGRLPAARRTGIPAAYGGRYVNTHNALLPSFPGIHGPRDALDYGVKVTGATLFIVDEGVDTGAIVAQVAVPVLDDDDEDTLTERIKVAERRQLVEHVGAMVRQGWTVTGRKVTIP